MEDEMISKKEQNYTAERVEEIVEAENSQKRTEEVFALINDVCPTNVKENSNSLQNDLGMDSLGLIMLLTMIEDTFEIELDESDMNPFELKTVQDVVDLVAKYFSDANEVGNDD